MSRNGPTGYPATRPPVRRPLAEDPFAAPPTGQPQWPPPHYPDPQGQRGQPAQPAQQQGRGQPPFYGQPPAYGQPPPFGAPEPQGQQPAQPYYFPQAGAEPEPAANYAPQAAGHQLPFGAPAQAPSYAPQQQQQHAQAGQRWSQQSDPQGYDLGNYMPTTAQNYAQPEPAHFQQAHDPNALQHQQEPDPAGFAPPQQGYAENDADFDEMLEEEPPRRGRRGLMIAAALVGAIGLGGAMAYSYKTFFAQSAGRAPVIKAADFGANKVKPEVPDGKGFPHTDKKLLNRLGEDGSGPVRIGTPPPNAADAQDDRASDDPNSPRKVKIIPITPGGAPATTASAPPRPAGPPMVAVPGVTLENMGPMQGPPSAARVQLPAPASAPAKVVQPPPAKVVSTPKAQPAALPPAAAEPAAPAVKVAAAPAKTPVPKAKTAVAAPVVATSATSGYVAVLSSKTSRMDALKAFADLQQKYGDVLSSKTPDVQEANLGDKGVRYRAVVGPPGSRDAASGVCKQLKTAGYNDCWVTAY